MSASPHPFIAAVDWGTTRLRIWLLDENGKVLGERRSDDGLLTTARDAFPAVLERRLADLGAADDLPAILCGMVGSRQGWVEVPYVDAPASIGAVFSGALQAPGVSRSVAIIPGMAQRSPASPDVMRGEETQLAGIADRLGAGRHIICLPGTHSKWIEIVDSAVTRWRTFLTGELFSLISKQSILRHSIGEAGETNAETPVFQDWARRSAAEPGGVMAKLFAIRASGLLFDMQPSEAAAALSGLLIGAEVGAARSMPDFASDAVTLVVSGQISNLYAQVLSEAGLKIRQFDAEEAVRAGLFEAGRSLFSDQSTERGDR